MNQKKETKKETFDGVKPEAAKPKAAPEPEFGLEAMQAEVIPELERIKKQVGETAGGWIQAVIDRLKAAK